MGKIRKFLTNPIIKTIALTIWFLAIVFALVVMYGKGNFATPSFIYQAF